MAGLFLWTLSWASGCIPLLRGMQPPKGRTKLLQGGKSVWDWGAGGSSGSPHDRDPSQEHWGRLDGGLWGKGQAQEHRALGPSVPPLVCPSPPTARGRGRPGDWGAGGHADSSGEPQAAGDALPRSLLLAGSFPERPLTVASSCDHGHHTKAQASSMSWSLSGWPR